ncbi:hypothetical protein [Thalassospira sp.]|uniref:hypothetical protein n=1 Tax=Thalassospira sp. TaxID=1912094 RepID=UPI000C5129A5|nr:hypothetical protein [Thalassospira sp.]MBC05702.1 hypothetical protein [Thalassospira sp.]|tara:strand:- start:2982 stop:3272 length:291 start_codon:yes stop_codon:yes gene_type:complete
MAIFNIVATTRENIGALDQAIAKAYDESDRMRINELYWMVSDNKSTVDVTKKIGIVGPKQDGIPAAIVTKVESYYGRAPNTIWEWMKVKLEGGNND